MPSKSSNVIEVHPLDVVWGGWCENCALPSLVTVTMALVDPNSLRIFGRTSRAQCTDCGRTS